MRNELITKEEAAKRARKREEEIWRGRISCTNSEIRSLRERIRGLESSLLRDANQLASILKEKKEAEGIMTRTASGSLRY